MTLVLSDHDCEGQARRIFEVLQQTGLAELAALELRLFEDMDLDPSADDEQVWRFCQAQGYLLLTGNRTAVGETSLERTIARLATPDSLPVLTISNLRRVKVDPVYCQRCAERLAIIVLDLEQFRGTRRIYLPG